LIGGSTTTGQGKWAGFKIQMGIFLKKQGKRLAIFID
jgi:hypothetical protein